MVAGWCCWCWWGSSFCSLRVGYVCRGGVFFIKYSVNLHQPTKEKRRKKRLTLKFLFSFSFLCKTGFNWISRLQQRRVGLCSQRPVCDDVRRCVAILSLVFALVSAPRLPSSWCDLRWPICGVAYKARGAEARGGAFERRKMIGCRFSWWRFASWS